MNLVQLSQIILAGRWTILVCLVACLGGALAFASRLSTIYEARAKVILEVVVPDPVTGITYGNKAIEPYARTQALLVSGPRVAGLVVDKLGWVDNPAVIDSWQQATGGVGDLRQWAAQRIAENTQSQLLEGGGTLVIIYRAPDPDAAATIVRLIREAYIQATLDMQTESAARRADRNTGLVTVAQRRLSAAERDLDARQRAAGVVTDAAGNDIEASRLTTLEAQQIRARLAVDNRDFAVAAQGGKSMLTNDIRIKLRAVDDRLALAEAKLGTANPDYQALMRRRATLVGELARAEAAMRSEAGSLSSLTLAARAGTDAAYRAERQRVLANRDVEASLAQSRRIVAMRRGEVERLAQSTANLRLQADRTESGLVIEGDVISNPSPVAPKRMLIAGLAGAFGLALGVLTTLLLALGRREVLGAEDLVFAAGVPVLTVVPNGAEASWRERIVARLPLRLRAA